MNIKDFLAELEEILEVDEGELDINSDLGQYEEWDSLSMMSVMALFNKQFSIPLKIRDIKNVTSVKELVALSNGNII